MTERQGYFDVLKGVGIVYVFLAIAAVNAGAWGFLIDADRAVNVDHAKSFLQGQPYILGSLWFVVCVFWSQLIVWLVSRIGNPFRASLRIPPLCRDWLDSWWPQVRDAALVVLMFALAHVLSKELAEFHRNVPLKLMSVPMCVVFVSLGVLIRPLLQKAGEMRLGATGALVTFAILLGIVVFAAQFGSRITNLCEVTYAKTGMFVLGSCSGILSSLALAKALDRGVTSAVFAYVGRNSMVFFLMEGVILMNCTNLVNLLGFRVGFPLFLREATMGWRIAMTAIGLVVTAALPPLVNPVLRLIKRPFGQKGEQR